MSLRSAVQGGPRSGYRGHMLAVLVLVIFYGAWAYVSADALPQTVYRQYDPEFDYFMTSLSPFKGAPYAYVDHPGTPVEILGTMFLAVTMPFVGGTSARLIDYHLRHPLLFFQIAYAFLILANLGCALYFYFTARSTGRIGLLPALALALMYYSMDFAAIGTITYWSHAAFSFPLGTLFLLVLCRGLRGAQGELRRRDLIGLGAGAGVLTSVILYLAPWLVGAVIAVVVFYRLRKVSWLRTLVAAATMLGSALAGFFVTIVPILWKWSAFWQWVLKLVLHQGRFGSGQEGIFSASGFVSSLAAFMDQLPRLFAVLGVVTVLLMIVWVNQRRRLGEQAAEWSLAVGLIVQIVLLLVVITKTGFAFYLLPLEAVIPALALVVLLLLGGGPRVRAVSGWFLVAFVLVSVVFSFRQNTLSRYAVAARIAADHARITEAIAAFARQKGIPVTQVKILWSYGIYEQCNALLHGNSYTDRRSTFDREIAAVCPNQYLIPNGATTLLSGGHWVQVAEATDSSTLIIVRQSTADYLLPLIPDAQAVALPSASGPIVVLHK